MIELIKPPCGLMGDIIPVYIRGKWHVSSYNNPDYRDMLDRKVEGFTWIDLVKLGVADTQCECVDVHKAEIVSMKADEALQTRWRKYLNVEIGQIMTEDEVNQTLAVMKLPKGMWRA